MKAERKLETTEKSWDEKMKVEIITSLLGALFHSLQSTLECK